MSQLTQQSTKSTKVKPKVQPMVRIPSTQFMVDVETGLVYLSQEQLKVLTQALR